MSLGGRLRDIRLWLDHAKIIPLNVRVMPNTFGFGFEVTFNDPDDAHRFREAFSVP